MPSTRKRLRLLSKAATLLASLAVHAALWGAVARAHRARPSAEPMAFDLVETERPKPSPPSPEPPKATEPPRAEPKAAPIRRVARATLKAAPPPPSNAAPEKSPVPSAAPPVVRIGVSLASTSTGGGFSVGVGNSLYGRVADKAADPSEVRPYAGGEAGRPARVVSAARLSSQPRLLEEPAARYTPEARKAGVEGQVVLLLDIDERGVVAGARVISRLGFGLDEVAEKSARALRFEPATLDGEPVATQIRFAFTFLLE